MRDIIPRIPSTTVGYLPRPALVFASDVASYVAQLDPPFTSLVADVTGKFAATDNPSADFIILDSQVLGFGARWGAEKAVIDGLLPGGENPGYSKAWSVLEAMELEYRAFRARFEALGYKVSQAAPPTKAEITPPPPLVDSIVGPGGLKSVETGLKSVALIGALGIGAYITFQILKKK